MNIMKLCLAASIVVTAAAHAQTPSDTNQAAQASPSANTQMQPGAASGQWVSPDAQPVHEKTRAEVYQELIQAEKDGQLDYLNSTIYAH